jgi:hypothetical protein
MKSDDLDRSLPSLFRELVHGAPAGGAFVLNPGDIGLLAALDRLSAADASRSSNDGGTVAAHVDHLCFGLSLLNRWAGGEENPFGGADWTASWKRTTVSDREWAALRDRLRDEAEQWHTALQEPREVAGPELDGIIGSVAHLAYHLGAIRQIAPGTRGPTASDSA